jgi:hypothetical protein
MSKKKGQFYIIAAIVIISVLVGLVSVSYFREEKPSTKVYDLGNELKIETAHVIDFGIYDKENTEMLIENWSENFYRYSGGAIDSWVFVYGNQNNITAMTFNKSSTGSIGLNIGGRTVYVGSEGVEKHKVTVPRNQSSNQVVIVIDSQEYPFELQEGQNFYFVIKSQKGAAQG